VGLADRDLEPVIDGVPTPFTMPDEIFRDDCEHGFHDYCECQIGTFFPPGERPDGYDLLRGDALDNVVTERGDRIARRRALAQEWMQR
jgi:hypothetical protein